MALQTFVTKIQDSHRHLKLALSSLEDTSRKDSNRTATTAAYAVGRFAQVQLKVEIIEHHHAEISSAFKIHNLLKHSNTQVYVTCNVTGKVKHLICPLEWSEFIDMGCKRYQLNSESCYTYCTIVDVVVNTSMLSPWTILHDHVSCADFHLSSEHGSVPVHKIVMAAHSDVFKNLLNGEWNEKKNGRLEVKGVTKETLQHLKDYMYLGSLPEQHEHLRPLLLIAKRYIMHDLEEACNDKLTRNATPEIFQGILEFAVDNHLITLISSVFRNTPVNVIDAYEVLNKGPKLKALDQ